MIILPSRRKCASLLLSQAVLISVIGAGLAAAAPAPSGGTVSIQTVPALEGVRIVIDPRQESSVSLSSRRTRLQNGVLTSQVVTWSVDSVSAGRGVAVSAMHPRFDPFGQSTWQLKLHPVRGTLIVDTVLKTAGVSFALDGATITTGEDGRGQGVITDLNAVVDRVRLDSGSAGPLSVSLVRVAKLPPGAPFHRHVLAVLTVRRPVSLAFRDASGAPV